MLHQQTIPVCWQGATETVHCSLLRVCLGFFIFVLVHCLLFSELPPPNVQVAHRKLTDSKAHTIEKRRQNAASRTADMMCAV
jgi:hypothetical protein